MPEILPFIATADFEEDNSTKNLFKFVDELSKYFGEEIYYIGQDTIGEKFYERFLFEKGGFLEIMTQAPVAVVAHFVNINSAKKFGIALKKAILKIKHPASVLLADSIEVQSEDEQVLDYKTWSKLKKIRDDN